MSVAGFVTHYVHFLDPFHQAGPGQQQPRHQHGRPDPVLVFAGYSYGAMITTRLPSLDTILEIFGTPTSGTPAAEIRLRAEHMADMENTVLGSARAAALDRQDSKSPRKAMAMRIGGDEGNRKSHDLPRRSFSLEAEEKFKDLIAKARKGHTAASSVSVVHKKRYKSAMRTASTDQVEKVTELHIQPVPSMTRFHPAYMLISPLQGLVIHLATMSFSNPFGKKTTRLAKPKVDHDGTRSPAGDEAASAYEAEHKLISNPTLAVYGDQDVFVAAKKLRDWAKRLETAPSSRFRAHGVSTAGHFWTEEGVLYNMRDAVRTFAEGLLVPESMLEEPVHEDLASDSIRATTPTAPIRLDSDLNYAKG